MGNTFGNMPNNGYNLYFHPDVSPHPHKETQFDPNFGFPNGRKERSIKATQAEMESAKIPLENRDYCVDFLLRFRTCRKDNWPWPVLCEHEKHEYLHCQHEDFIMRMKDYEREKRLLIREKRKQAMAA